MYRAMVGVGVVCGLLIVSVYQVTLPVIEQNKAEALQAAILHVLPEARVSTTFRLDEAGGFEALDGESQGAARIYAGYDENDKLVGLAVEAQGMGYQDVIRLIYGYSYADDAIIGVQVLESKETPGLGDRIETDPGFLRELRTTRRIAAGRPVESRQPDRGCQSRQEDPPMGNRRHHRSHDFLQGDR